MADATVFNSDPADQARIWEDAGFTWIHVVDLNGAIEGAPRNAGAVTRILDRTSCAVQLGGGIRSLERIAYWVDAGVQRVVLGTTAVRDPELVREAAREYPEQIVVAVDVKEGEVAVEGWVEKTGEDAVDVARGFEDCGVAALIVTDIDRDGLNGGVNAELTGRIADGVDIPVIASGGVSGASDLRTLRDRPGRPIAGAIVGRALYDGRVTPAEALAAVK